MTNSGDMAISARELRRSFVSDQGIVKVKKKVYEALKGVDLEVGHGEIFGLLGPNGAGKTTFTKVMSTILLPTSGEARVLGFDVVQETQEVRKRIGLVLGGERGLYYRLTARQSLEYWAALYRLEPRVAKQRVPRLLELVGLSDRADDRVEGYSRGMKQRLHLARGLINEPELIFLDEPTVGLDPVASLGIRDVIRQLSGRGVTILMTTHYMAEAEALCDRVAFINEGKIMTLDAPSVLTQIANNVEIVEVHFSLDQTTIQQQLEVLSGVVEVKKEPALDVQRFVIKAKGKTCLPGLLRELSLLGVTRVSSKEPTLEDVYLELLGERGMRV